MSAKLTSCFDIVTWPSLCLAIVTKYFVTDSCYIFPVEKFIVLITRIINLADIVTQALKSNLCEAVSPEIVSDILWLLQCFTTAYLFVKETDDNKLPDVLKNTFSHHSSCGKQLVGLNLDIAETCLMCMTAEESVAEDSVQLLLRLVRCNSRSVPYGLFTLLLLLLSLLLVSSLNG